MSKAKLKQVLEEVDIAEEAFHNGFAQGLKAAEDDFRKEIELRIKANQTKNGFPAGTLCAVRIEAYEELLNFLGKK